MEIMIAAIVALLVGILVGRRLARPKPIGDLRVDRSDPDGGPYLFLELDTDVPTILHKKHVTFRVKAKDFIPHE